MFSIFCAFHLHEGKPKTLFTFPPSSPDDVKGLAMFGYPCAIPENKVTEMIQYFRLDKQRRWAVYTHCHKTNLCVCIAGRRPYFSLYRSILTDIRNYLSHGTGGPTNNHLVLFESPRFLDYLQALFMETVPPSASYVNIPSLMGEDEVLRRQPLYNVLKSTKLDKDASLDLLTLSEEVLTVIYFWTLMGGRQYLFSKNLKRICNCVLATVSLILPLKYLELVINLLPTAEYLQSPLPCIFGVTEPMFKQVERQGLLDDGYLAVDLDSNQCYWVGESAMVTVPPQFIEFLTRELQKVRTNWRQCTSAPSSLSGATLLESYAEALCRAFVTTTVAILCGYKSALVPQKDSVGFTRESFVNVMKNKLPACEEFYHELYGKSHIQQFLQKRAQRVSAASPKGEDEFDAACARFMSSGEMSRLLALGKKSSAHHSGVTALKKITGQGRDKIQDLANKTMPVLKNGVLQIQRKAKMHRDKTSEASKASGLTVASSGRDHARSDPPFLASSSSNISIAGKDSERDSTDSVNMRRSDSVDFMSLDAAPAFAIAQLNDAQFGRSTSSSSLQGSHHHQPPHRPAPPRVLHRSTEDRPAVPSLSLIPSSPPKNEPLLIDLNFDDVPSEGTQQGGQPLKVTPSFLLNSFTTSLTSQSSSPSSSLSSPNMSHSSLEFTLPPGPPPAFTPFPDAMPMNTSSSRPASGSQVPPSPATAFGQIDSWITFHESTEKEPNKSSSPTRQSQSQRESSSSSTASFQHHAPKWPPVKPEVPARPKMSLQELMDLNMAALQPVTSANTANNITRKNMNNTGSSLFPS